MDRFLVDEEAVGALLVLPQAFAVVGRQDDEEIVAEPVPVDVVGEPGDLAVREGDLAEVGILAVLALKRLRRRVGGVRIVEVDPGEELAVLLLLEPAQGLVDDLVGGPLDLAERDPFEAAQVELVEVGVEALVEAPLGVEDVGGDEGRRVVAPGLERLGHGLELRGDDEAAVVADAVEGRQRPGQDGRVRGQGQGRLADAVLEPDAPGGEGVDGRRPDRGIAVTADLVGPERVHGDEDDVEIVVAAEPGEVGPSRLEHEQDGRGRGQRRRPRRSGSSCASRASRELILAQRKKRPRKEGLPGLKASASERAQKMRRRPTGPAAGLTMP